VEVQLKFIDEVVVFLSSGKGGRGQLSFRREKFVPRGGPDGGDGGAGGAIVLEAMARRNTLIDYRRARHHRAQDGVSGGKRQMTGARGQDLVLGVPVGTVVYDDETQEQLSDLDQEGARWVLPGGEGGLGNMHFKTSSNRTPRQTTPGGESVELRVRLELKLLADVGLLGFPNAGKSTFLSAVTAAQARVADYPFTTLVPQLGVVRVSEGRTFVVADIPGLIDGAAEGAGLGHQFLRHVERCKAYIHLVAPDGYDGTAVSRYESIRRELAAFDATLPKRPQVVVLSKIDILTPDELTRQCRDLSAAAGSKVFPISSVTGEGVPALIHAIWQFLEQQTVDGTDERDETDEP
jgi:GTP-binding protein